MKENTTQTATDQTVSEKINNLRKEHNHFDEYLIGKDLSDYKVLIRAFLHEVNNYKKAKDIDYKLDDSCINKEASKILLLIRNLSNRKKADRTKIYIGALTELTGASKYSDIDFDLFNNMVDNMDPDAFMDSPSEEIDYAFGGHNVNLDNQIKFTKYLILRIVKHLSQNGQSPPIDTSSLQEGIFKNETKVVSKATFHRYLGDVNIDDDDLKLLIELTNIYNDDFGSFLHIVKHYHISNYNSAYIKRLGLSDNLAITIPRYKDVDYESIRIRANLFLSRKNSKNTSNDISLDKIVLFLFLIIDFEREKFEAYDLGFNSFHFSVSSVKLSKYIGDPKVCSSIRDAYELEGVFTEKINPLSEVNSSLYKISVSGEVDKLFALSDPFLIYNLNVDHSLTNKYFSEDRFLLLNKVIDVIDTKKMVVVKRTRNRIVINRIKYRPNRESYKVRFRKDISVKVSKSLLHETVDHKINLTNVFLKSGDFSPIRSLFIIVLALKSRVTGYNVENIDKDLALAFDSVDFSLAKKLYHCSHNKLSGILNHFTNRSHFNFHVPTLNLTTKVEIMREMMKKQKDENLNDNPQVFDKKVIEAFAKELESNNEDFINMLKDYCNITEDEEAVQVEHDVFC